MFSRRSLIYGEGRGSIGEKRVHQKDRQRHAGMCAAQNKTDLPLQTLLGVQVLRIAKDDGNTDTGGRAGLCDVFVPK